jgi:thymidylate synthase ThyX
MPRGWTLLFQPWPDSIPGIPVCGPKCKAAVIDAMENEPVQEPLVEITSLPLMEADIREAMEAEIRDACQPRRRRETMRIKVSNKYEPEDNAMLQALYSRSPEPVDSHMAKVEEAGSGKFMDRYYIGYGHKSIGDCGTTTVFIENVSMLAAKAIQDWPLYNGQEGSTRYMDFSTAEFSDPIGAEKTRGILEDWREFYLAALNPVTRHLKEKYPIQEGEDEKVYERAIKARCFDILRCWLPAGARTQLSWHTNLRQARERLEWLEEHPMGEIAEMARYIHHKLAAAYPNSFNPGHSRGQLWRRAIAGHHIFDPSDSIWHRLRGEVHLTTDLQEEDDLDDPALLRLLNERPRGVELPRFLAELGNIRSMFLLDFGSYRDVQRHRNGTIRMPLLTTKYGFHPWYLDQLPPDLRETAEEFIETQKSRIDALDYDPVVVQNYIAMGFQVPCQVTQSLPAFVYRLELRSSKHVHPTLRSVVHKEIKDFRDYFPTLTLHVDLEEDKWSIRRGQQTIEEKS